MKLYLFLLLSIGVYAWAELPDTVADKAINTNLENLDMKTAKAQKDINTVLNRASSISANGYSYFPNGVLMQWGSETNTVAHGTNVTIEFPKAFDSEIFQVIVYIGPTVSAATTVTYCPLVSKTTSSFICQYGAINGGSYATTVQFVAIGR